MAYKATITSTDGCKHSDACGGLTDQEALIYAGKVVEQKADEADTDASVAITNDGKEIGPAATVADVTRKVV